MKVTRQFLDQAPAQRLSNGFCRRSVEFGIDKLGIREVLRLRTSIIMTHT